VTHEKQKQSAIGWRSAGNRSMAIGQMGIAFSKGSVSVGDLGIPS